MYFLEMVYVLVCWRSHSTCFTFCGILAQSHQLPNYNFSFQGAIHTHKSLVKIFQWGLILPCIVQKKKKCAGLFLALLNLLSNPSLKILENRKNPSLKKTFTTQRDAHLQVNNNDRKQSVLHRFFWKLVCVCVFESMCIMLVLKEQIFLFSKCSWTEGGGGTWGKISGFWPIFWWILDLLLKLTKRKIFKNQTSQPRWLPFLSVFFVS